MKKIFIPAFLLCLFFTSCGMRNNPPDYSSFDAYMAIPFHGQKTGAGCGLAAIEMIADYYGRTLDTHYTFLLENEARLTGGIKAAGLKKCLEQSGFNVAVFPGTPDHSTTGIYMHLDKKRPLAILASQEPGKTGHYLVVNGYKASGPFLVIDPGHPDNQEEMDAEHFIKIWKNEGSLTLLALPRQR